MAKLRVAVLFGGKSAEHEVSLQSAKNVISALDRQKYELILIGIDKTGQWYLYEDEDFLINPEDPKTIALKPSHNKIAIVPGNTENQLISIAKNNVGLGHIDVVFPVLHGTFGEDGTVQGLLKLANLPFVGAGVTGSAVGMDKDVMKRLLKADGLPIGDFESFGFQDKDHIDYKELIKRLGTPIFIKPANMGSSVGISKVYNEEAFHKAIEEAFKYDSKIIIEENIKGRELECSVLGNKKLMASLPGEILPQADFYSYEAKYIDENGAFLEVPAKLSEYDIKRVQETSMQAYRSLCCEGLARADLFMKDNGDILINEINTIPGFTKISMYPKLWEVSGLPCSELIDKLIELAIERFNDEENLVTQAQI